MRSDIKWQHIKGKTDEGIVKCVEKILDIKFPDDYLDCVKRNPGGRPSIGFFETEMETMVYGKGGSFEYLFEFNPESHRYILNFYYIFNFHSGGDNQVPDGIIPFASASYNHDVLCFDYREGFPPTIILLDIQKHWDYIESVSDNEFSEEVKEEDYLIEVCNSFTELLDMLTEPPKR